MEEDILWYETVFGSKKKAPTDRQLQTIRQIHDRCFSSPTFTGTTMTEASEYIDKYGRSKERRRHNGWTNKGSIF